LSISSGPSPQNVQYSDPITDVTILAEDNDPGSEMWSEVCYSTNGGTSFSSGLPSAIVLTADDASGNTRTWTLSGYARVFPGTYLIKVKITDGVGCFSTINITICVKKEDAEATYTGPDIISTGNTTSCTATITMSATVKDITAVNPGSDNAPGDIRRARVKFISTGSYPFDIRATVGLVDPADSLVGTATALKQITLNNTDCSSGGATLTIFALIDSFYTNAPGTCELATQNITISVPGKDNVNGGGYLVMSNASSAGRYKGKPGTKTNFGFTMKYNKSGKNLQGQTNIIIRADNDSMYQIKSNAINSMTASGNIANFSTKASITNITDPLAPYPLGGNLTLLVAMVDSTRNTQSDSVSITVQDNNGGLVYSSEWNGTKTVLRSLRKPSGGGNVSVMSSSLAKEGEGIPEEYALFQNYPNPFNPSTTIQFDLPEESRVSIIIYDILGREVIRVVDEAMEAGRYRRTWESQDRSGRTVASGVYIMRIDARSVVSERKLITVRKMLLLK
jgi:hypothetical protein